MVILICVYAIDTLEEIFIGLRNNIICIALWAVGLVLGKLSNSVYIFIIS